MIICCMGRPSLVPRSNTKGWLGSEIPTIVTTVSGTFPQCGCSRHFESIVDSALRRWQVAVGIRVLLQDGFCLVRVSPLLDRIHVWTGQPFHELGSGKSRALPSGFLYTGLVQLILINQCSHIFIGWRFLLALSGLQFWVGQLVNDHVIQFLFAGCGSGPLG